MTREGWKEISLGKLCTLRAGSVFKTHYQGSTEGDFQFIKVSDMNLPGNQFRIHEANHWVDDSVRAEMRAKPFPEGTTVFAKIGEALKQNRVRFLVRGTLIDNNMMGAIPNRDVIDPEFFFYRLSDFNIAATATGTALPYLTISALAQERFAIPPIPVQRRIASVLSAYDKLIENNQRRIKILETMARALYREWFVEFRFPGHEEFARVASPLGDIPQGWEVKSIQQLGTVITGKTPSKGNLDFYGNDMPFVKTPDMHGNMFTLGTNDCLSTAGAESQATKTLPAGSICVSCIGTIGVVSITTEDCQTNQQINSVVVANSVSREFLFLRLQDAKQTLENLGANGATMGNVNKGKFKAMKIVCPPDNLLARYHRLVEPMFSEILSLFRHIQTLSQTRDLLLPRLLSGQVALTDTAA